MDDTNVVDTAGAEAGTPEVEPALAQGQPEGQEAGRSRGKDGRFQGQPQAKPPAEKRRYEVKSKSGGVEVLELDDDEIRNRLSLTQEAQHRMRQVAQQRKELEAERAQIKAEREKLASVWRDPAALRRHLHEAVTDPDEAHRIKIQLVKLDLDERQMDPRDRELRDLKEKMSAREREEQAAAEKAEREKADAELREKVEQLRPIFMKKLEGVLTLGGLPTTARTLERAAELWKENSVAGLDLDESEMAQALKSELDAELNARLGDESLTDDAFVAAYPQVVERVKRVIRQQIAAKRGGGAAPPAREPPVVAPRQHSEDGRRPPPRPMTREEERKIFGV